MYSIYRLSDAQPDWAENDPSQPDYIKNKDLAEKIRPISVNGNEILGDSLESGGLNLVAGRNVTLKVDGNTVTISAVGGGGASGCGCPDYVEGQGIDIVPGEEGDNMIISIEPESITGDLIGEIPIDKIVQTEGSTLVMNGGSIDG